MARRTDPTPATVRLVRERDGNACVRCGTTNQLTTQHRVARGMGGSRADYINRPDNLVTLCGSGTTGCHGEVEANPRWAQLMGYSVRRGLEGPAGVHVWWHGEFVKLTEAGTVDLDRVADRG